ncbi:hypothetical protein CP965_06840 [Halarcobacter mediterraneus]|uniref:Flagellar hook-associated protein 2 n=1 Tax=Halarcobacter mediterraneus TaxID=2023153 RepID=A0A4V1M1F8_9BACT|nr:flagellar filament capping protein FliD [Halarcobacter mediterraneus]RXK13514.1 hypothetical protein CP965_06840 [Halarcobacter mediterraneus]
MAEGILGLGSSGASSLNQELLDKLKEAERKSTVEPVENDLEDWTAEDEKFQEIVTKANELLDSIKPFDLFASGGVNAFNQKSANVTGSSAIFDAVDAANLSEGTTSVKINQLAQKDVYQSITFANKEAQVAGGNDAGDMMILSQSGRPVYQSDFTVNSASDIVDPSGGDITINIDGSDRVFEVSSTTTYKQLIDKINEDQDLSATITINGRLSINSADEKTELTISNNLNSTSLGMSLGEKYSTEGKTYEQLANEINTNSNYNATIETVGTDTNRLVIKSSATGLDNAINITQNGFDLGLNSYSSTSTVTGTDSLSDGLSITIDGETFTTSSDTYDSFIAKIDANANFSASIVDGKVNIQRADGTNLSISNDDLNLGMENSNHTLKAQNLEANVDGIEYDVASNVLVVDGGLKITAVEVDTESTSSTISIQNDTSTISTMVDDFVTKYNEFMDLVNAELYSADSSIDDKSTLRTVVSEIKDKLFNNYGSNEDLNIFNFGLEIDKTGYLSLDSAKFNEAIEEDLDIVKSLFVGSAESEGMGTQLKEYLDSLDSLEGLFTFYEENMDRRKTNLEEDKTEAQETLDSKYAQLAAQFAQYTTIITNLEAQFSSLKLMIAQSSAS